MISKRFIFLYGATIIILVAGCKHSATSDSDVRKLLREKPTTANHVSPVISQDVIPHFGNTAVAIKWKELIDQRGLSQAQYWLGMSYLHGDGLPLDATNAYLWLSKAASNNLVEAQYQVGVLTAAGLGIAKNYEKAVEWYQLASSNGNADAQFALGISYGRGKGISKDLAKSFKWIYAAATNGLTNAMTPLAYYYWNGMGVQRDLTNAYIWYKKSANLGNPQAQVALALSYYMYSNEGGAKEQAVELVRSAANHWYPQAQYFFSLFCVKGDGVVKDTVEAYKWASLASDNGYEYARGLRDAIQDGEKLDSSQIADALQRAKEFSRTNPVQPENVNLPNIIDMNAVFGTVHDGKDQVISNNPKN